MMSPVPRIVHFALGALCLGLSAVVVAELVGPAAGPAAPSQAGAADIEVPPDRVAAAPNADHLTAQILDRPLFTPGRRPPEAVADSEPEEEAKPPQLQGRLAGVVIHGEDGEALFARQGQKPVTVTEGDEIDGWTVDAIEADRVLLSSEFGSKVLELSAEARGKVPTAAAAAARKAAATRGAKTAAAARRDVHAKAPAKPPAGSRPVSAAPAPNEAKSPPIPKTEANIVPRPRLARETGQDGL
jgi:hypothetical protein